MDLKILHAADLHMDSPFASFSTDVQDKLRNIQRTIPDKLLEISRREHCNIWLLAGDVFDGHDYSRESLAALQRALEECGVPVFISPGNHDYYSSDSPWAREKWPNNVYIFKGKMEAVSIPEHDCIVYGAGFQSMDSDSLLNGFRALGKAEHEIMVMHGDPIHVKSNYNSVTSQQVLHSGLDYVALGHVHAHGNFISGNSVCAWPGCPMGRGWDESGAKGVYIATLNSETSVSFYPLDMPQFHDVQLKSERELQSFIPSIKSRDYYRLTLSGKRTGKSVQLQKILSDYANIRITDKMIEAPNPWDALGEDSFRGSFFGHLKNRFDETSGSEAEIIHLATEIASDILCGIEVDIP